MTRTQEHVSGAAPPWPDAERGRAGAADHATSGRNTQSAKLDPDQVRQIVKAIYEVARHGSGYGRVEIRIDKGRALFITRCFDDRLLPGEMKDATE